MLERGRVGQTWRGRWDSFCLVTPNWTVQLPGRRLRRRRPRRLHDARRDRRVPRALRGGLRGAGARGRRGHRRSSRRPTAASCCSTLGRRDPRALGRRLDGRVPAAAPAADRRSLPDDLLQIDADDYRNRSSLPDGQVLVIGSGQTGCQIAEELIDAGREVVPLVRAGALGAAADRRPRPASGGRSRPASSTMPVERAAVADRRGCSRTSSPPGATAGTTSTCGRFGRMGVTLLGRFRDAVRRRGAVRARPARQRRLGRPALPRVPRARAGTSPTSAAMKRPDLPRARLLRPHDAREHRRSTDVGAVVFAGGFRPDYAHAGSHVPGAFDPLGFPRARGGREHGRAGPVLRRRALPAQAQARRSSGASARTPRSSRARSPRRARPP